MSATPSDFDRVEERFLLPPWERCPLCDDDGPRSGSLVLQHDPPVTLSTCGRCHGSSASRMPSEAFTRALYDPARYASGLLRQPALTDRFGRHLAALLRVPADRDLDILDYGGNDGGLSRALVRAMRSRGHRGQLRCTVVDLFERPDTPEVTFRTTPWFSETDARFDLVLASAVLEHLTDFRPVVARLLELCRPGALFYGRTPYEASLHRWLPGYAIRWPRHVHDLGPRFFGRLLPLYGYRGSVVHSQPSPAETSLRSHPARTLAAHLLKVPAALEARIRGPASIGEHGALWTLVGGWEATLRVEGRLGS